MSTDKKYTRVGKASGHTYKKVTDKIPTPAQKLAETKRDLAMDIVQKSKEIAAISVRAALLNESKISRNLNKAVSLLMENIQYQGTGKQA